MAYLFQRGETFWGGMRNPATGKRIQFSLGTKNERVARDVLRQKELAILTGKQLDHQEDRTLSDALAKFLAHAESIGRATDTVLRFKIHVGKFIASCPAKTLKTVRIEHVEDFLDGIQRSARTRNHHLTNLRAFFNWCVKRGWLDKNPCAGVETQKEARGQIEYLTPEECQVLLAAAKDTPSYLPVALGIYAGLRRGEIIRLEWQDVDFDRRTLFVGNKASGATKSRKNRTIELHPALEAALEARRRPLGRVCGYPDTYEGRRDLSESVKALLRSTGVLQGSGLQILRHTFASLLAQAHVSIYVISAWLGHSSVQITQNYYAQLGTAYTGAIERLLPEGEPAGRIVRMA